jgi:dihydroxyacetone kinase, phosphotransfer subunit
MLGFVVVSHSKDLAEAVIHLANEMKRYDFPLINGSGTEGDFLGSNPLTIKEAIMNAKTDKGALVFVDIGSSVLNTQVAIDFLADEGVDVENIKIADAPLVEGLIAGGAINDEKADMESILNELKELKTFSKLTY